MKIKELPPHITNRETEARAARCFVQGSKDPRMSAASCSDPRMKIWPLDLVCFVQYPLPHPVLKYGEILPLSLTFTFDRLIKVSYFSYIKHRAFWKKHASLIQV